VAGSPYTISAVLSPAGVLGNYTITYNTANFTITPKAASVTPDAKTKIYGDADPTLTGTLSGFLAGDSVTAAYSRISGETVAGSPYTISAVLSPAGVLGNYTITYNTANFTITPKAASVTPDAKTKVYGDADPTLTGTLSGFLAGDSVTAAYSRISGETVAGSPYTISAVLSPAGVLGNYTITYNTANFTITPLTITVTADAKTKVYGDADPTLTGTLSGFLAGDSVTAAYSRISGETVAGSPYTISAVLSPAGVLGNYTITYNTANFTITPLTITVTADAKTKVYGAADPALTYTLSPALVGSDTFTGALSRAAGENIGPYAISQDTLALSSNYTLNYVGANLTITPKALTVTANNRTKIYGATVTFAGTEFAAGGLVNGDTVTGVTLTSAGAAAGATVAGSPYAIMASAAAGTGLGNYTISYVDGALTLSPKALTVTANNRTKIYGATVTFAGTEFAAGGLVNGDTVTSVTLTSAGAAAGAAVASPPYFIVPSAATGTGLGNYTISYVSGSLTVSKASIGLSMSSSLSTVVHGREVTFTASVTGTGATGTVTFKDGETILGSSTLSNGTATYATSTLSAGTHSITAVYGGDGNFAGNTSSDVPLTVKTPSGVNWALIGAIIAAVVLFGLFFFLLFMRRKKKPNQPQVPTPTPSRT
jgi:hypothetical protein